MFEATTKAAIIKPMSRRPDDRQFAEVERCNEVVETLGKLEENYAALKRRVEVEANREQTNKMAATAEKLCIVLQTQFEVDSERVGKITVAVEKLQRKLNHKNIIPLINRSKLATRRSYSGEWRSSM